MSATRATVVRSAEAARSSAYDCFYVYPTVSQEPADNSDLAVQDSEISVARLQASRFSAVCNVWAPMYRQVPSTGAGHGVARREADAVAYRSLAAGWHDYLAHHNDGKPIVLIGHSQGAFILIKLLHDEIDPNPTLRGRLVSAILAGGNLRVSSGQVTGGSLAHIPVCTSDNQVGCVIAFSPPPPDALFGRVGQGLNAPPGPVPPGQQVACTNPANLGGGTAPLEPYFRAHSDPTPGVAVTTPWVSFPGLYTAICMQGDGASWLQVTTAMQAGDHRPTVVESGQGGPEFGFHSNDVNLALGDLVADVASEESAYRSIAGVQTHGQ